MRWGGGLGISYGIPGGNLYQGESLSDVASGMINFEGQGDLVILQRVVVGGHIGIGFGGAGDGLNNGCNADGASCSIWDFDIGIHAEYRFLPPPSMLNPWVGLGLSYEVLGLSEDDGNGNNETGTFGSADVDFSGGLDFQLGPIGGGPFIKFRYGSYTSTSLSVNGEDVADGTIGSTSGHDWFMLGLRGRY